MGLLKLFKGDSVFHSPDYVHQEKVETIYPRTDYLFNVDTTIPRSLLSGFYLSEISEPDWRIGMPENDRGQVPLPAALVYPKFPHPGKKVYPDGKPG